MYARYNRKEQGGAEGPERVRLCLHIMHTHPHIRPDKTHTHTQANTHGHARAYRSRFLPLESLAMCAVQKPRVASWYLKAMPTTPCGALCTCVCVGVVWVFVG